MVLAEFRFMVEGIHSVKSKMDAYIVENGGSIPQACLSLYRRAIFSDFVQKVAETFATRILLIGIGLVTNVIVARILGPEGRGLYAVAVAIGAIGVQFGNLGLHASNTYYVARDRELLPSLVGNTLLVSFVFGGLCAGLAWVIFTLWPRLAPVEGPLLVMALVWIPFSLAYMLLQNLLIGIQEVRAYNKIELLTKIFSVCLIGLVIVIGTVTVETVFSMVLIALTISFAWAMWRLQTHLKHLPLPSFALFKDNINYGFKAYLSAFFAFLVLRVDVLMIKYMLGSEQTGYYAIAVGLANMIYLFPATVGLVLFPKLCTIKDWSDKFRMAMRVSMITGIIMLPGIGVVVLIAEWAITILYGHAFQASAIPFMWLMPGVFIWSIESIARRLLICDGYRTEVVYAWFASLVVNIALNFLLIPQMGIKGAALASSISLSFLGVATILLIWKLVTQNPLIVTKNL